jgi:hypothetical protein
MSSPASTAPQVLAWLVANVPAALPATLLGSPVIVQYGDMGTNVPPCFITVGATVAAVNTPWEMVGTGGAGWLEERYRVEVQVSAFEGGDSFQATAEAAYLMWQAVASTVRGNPTIDGLVITAYPASHDLTQLWEQNHKGPIAEIRAEIEVHARI